MTNTNTYTMNEIKNFKVGDKFFVGNSGSGRTVFGEQATLTKITKLHLVFTTESGTIVKTKIDNLNEVVGKAKKQNIFVSDKEWKKENYIQRNIKII